MKRGLVFLLGAVAIVFSLTCAGIGEALSQNISRDPTEFAPYGLPLSRTTPTTVNITLHAHERVGTLDAGPDGVVDTGDDVRYNYFTFGHSADPTSGKVPGPFIRVLQGDTVNFTIVNPATNSHTHSIDLHALKATGGGATTLITAPGTTASLTAEVMHPGLFVYHCVGEGASNIPSIAHHIANGMFGMILVVPRTGGFPFRIDSKKADKEFYVMQSEVYTTQPTCCAVGDVDLGKGLLEEPDYVVFNGRAGVERTTLTFNPSGNIVTPVVMSVNLDDDVIIYFGNLGPNFTSSPHMIGDMWDREYHLGDVLSRPLRNIGTSSVPAAGTAAFAFKSMKTGLFVLVDHAVFRVAKGALGAMVVQ